MSHNTENGANKKNLMLHYGESAMLTTFVQKEREAKAYRAQRPEQMRNRSSMAVLHLGEK